MDLQACGFVFLPSCNSCFINALNFAFFIEQTTVKTKKMYWLDKPVTSGCWATMQNLYLYLKKK